MMDNPPLNASHAFADCPLPGLRPVGADSAHWPASRQPSLEQALARLSAQPVLIVLGEPGTGKTSLLQAGLLPAVRAGRRPGGSSRCLELQPEANPPAALDQAAASAPPGVLVIDALENVWAAGDPPAFAAGLARAVQAGWRVVLAGRAECEARLAELPCAAPPIWMRPATPVELRQIIAQTGLHFEPGLAAEVARSVTGQADALPLPQFSLARLWQARTGDRLTWPAYRQLSGGSAGVRRAAETVYEALDAPDQAALRQVCLQLVEPQPGLAFSQRARPCACPRRRRPNCSRSPNNRRRLAGLAFEPDLAAALAREAHGQPQALALLQFSLAALWRARRGSRLTWEAYRACGDARLAPERAAEAAYAALTADDRLAVRRSLIRLTRVEGEIRFTRRPLIHAMLCVHELDQPQMDRALAALTAAGVLDCQPAARARQDRFQLTVIAQRWPRLLDWLDDERARRGAKRSPAANTAARY